MTDFVDHHNSDLDSYPDLLGIRRAHESLLVRAILQDDNHLDYVLAHLEMSLMEPLDQFDLQLRADRSPVGVDPANDPENETFDYTQRASYLQPLLPRHSEHSFEASKSQGLQDCQSHQSGSKTCWDITYAFFCHELTFLAQPGGRVSSNLHRGIG